MKSKNLKNKTGLQPVSRTCGTTPDIQRLTTNSFPTRKTFEWRQGLEEPKLRQMVNISTKILNVENLVEIKKKSYSLERFKGGFTN